MKFNIKYITFSALLCASMVSCDLDVVPPSDISTETFWKNEKCLEWIERVVCRTPGHGYLG